MESHWELELQSKIAQNKNYAGVILESPFTSMIDMGKINYPFFASKIFYLKINMKVTKRLSNIKSPSFNYARKS